VPSIAGKHEGWQNVLLTGHTRIMKVVRNMAMRIAKGMPKELILECQVIFLLRTFSHNDNKVSVRVLVLGIIPRNG
jgi:hypothetical protein